MIVLVLGGARSGKSAVAEARAAALAGDGAVTYLATAVVDPSDTDMAERVAAHQARRPSTWTTREVGIDLADVLRRVHGVALVDGLGTWLAGHGDRSARRGGAERSATEADEGALTDALTERSGDTVVVSDEVGLGVHPSTEAGRAFRDRLGLVNQAVAVAADEVLLVVAGRALALDRVGARTEAQRTPAATKRASR